MSLKSTLFTLVLLLKLTFPMAQNFTETYFAANNPKLGGAFYKAWKTDDYLFLATSKRYLTESTTPCLTAFSKNGQVLWDSKNWGFVLPETAVFKEVLLASDGFLYVLYYETTGYYLRKVKPATGETVWNRPFDPVLVPYKIVEQSPGQLAITQISGQSMVMYISVADGTLIKAMPNPFGGTFLKKDADGNLFLTRGDTIIKVNGQNPSEVLWKKKLAWVGLISDFGIQEAQFSPDFSKLMVYGNDGFKSLFALLNTQTGQMLKTQISVEGKFRDAAIRGNTAYTVWDRELTGGSALILQAIDLTTGNFKFSKNYEVNQFGTTSPLPYVAYGTESVALDAAGDVYLTGNGNADFFGGVWCMVKVDGTTGDKMYDKIFNNPPTDLAGSNHGFVAWCPDGEKLWVAGLLDWTEYSTLPRLFSIEKATGNTLSQVDLPGVYQFQSQARQILPLASGNFVLKQIDNCVAVAKLDAAGQTAWEKNLCDPFLHRAMGLYAGENNSLLVTAMHASPYSSGLLTDSVFIFRLDQATGQIQKKWALTAIGFPMYAYEKNGKILLVYSNGGSRSQLEISGNLAGPEKVYYTSTFTEEPITNYHQQYIERGSKLFNMMSVNNFVAFEAGKLPEAFYTPATNVFAYSMAAIPNSTDVLIAGTTAAANQLGAARINLTSQTAVWEKAEVFANWWGEAPKFLATTADGNHAWGLDIQVGKLALWKFTTANGTKIFSKSIDLTYPVAIHDFKIDAEGNAWAVGEIRSALPEKNRVLILKFDPNGNLVTNFQQFGDEASLQNRALCLHIASNGNKICGGQIQKNSLGKAGFLWGLPGQFFVASGQVFVDKNDNQFKDAGEPGYAQTVSFPPANDFQFPDSTGFFQFTSPASGSFSATVATPSPHYEVVKADFSLSNAAPTSTGLKVRIRPKTAVFDEKVKILPKNAPRFGFQTELVLELDNLGTLPTDSLELAVDCGSDFQFEAVEKFENVDTIFAKNFQNGQLNVRFLGKNPLEKQALVAVGQLTNFLAIGETVGCRANLHILPNVTDADLQNNTDSVTMPVVGSFDPNDITATPGGEVAKADLAPDGSLAILYRIRFENTGNFPTDFVRVVAKFDPDLALSTLHLHETSAPCRVEFLGNGLVEFSFDNYQLAPFTQDSVRAQGFVFVEIRTRPALVVGDQINASAEIYFDYNPPIFTNQAQTRIVEMVAVDEPSFSAKKYSIYPNPASQRIYLQSVAGDFPIYLRIKNEIGATVFAQTIGNELDVRFLPTGIYFLEIIDKNGGRFFEKLVKM